MNEPNWIEYGKTWDRFSIAGLSKPGTLVDIKPSKHWTGGYFLIGHINVMSGVCDDCMDFEGHAIVLRYAVVWDC